jgi:hypothetical protein
VLGGRITTAHHKSQVVTECYTRHRPEQILSDDLNNRNVICNVGCLFRLDALMAVEEVTWYMSGTKPAGIIQGGAEKRENLK